MSSLTSYAAALPVLLLTAAAAADEGRIACWEGDLAACEAGVAANPDDLYWLAQATWAYDNAGDFERADPLRRALGREVREIGVIQFALEQLGRQELAEGSPQRAIDAFTILADYSDRIAMITHINQTGGSPYPPDSFTRELMAEVAGAVRRDALEGRGIAHLLAGDADAAIADLRAALELGSLRETLRFLRDRGIDYQGAGRFSIAAIDAELEALLRGLAEAAKGAGSGAFVAIPPVDEVVVLADGYRVAVTGEGRMVLTDPAAHARMQVPEADLAARIAIQLGAVLRTQLGRATLPEVSGAEGAALAAAIAAAMDAEGGQFGLGETSFDLLLVDLARPDADPIRLIAP